jgi:Protein of unknown function (DUF4240)
MDEEAFWSIIEQAKAEAGDDPDDQLELIKISLSELPDEDILEFERLFYALDARAFRADLWGAAYVINGGCSEDAFDYFRAWLIGQGREVYENALANPDSLADLVDEDSDVEFEFLLYAAIEAYEEKTGEDDFYERLGRIPRAELLGDLDTWSDGHGHAVEAKIKRLYPKLFKKLWAE